MSSTVKPTKAIIIAAGMGKRLQPYTNTMPKSLVPIAGVPMLVRTINIFRELGVQDIIIIRGYKGHVFEERLDELGKCTFVDNLEYEQNNILLSFFKAEQEIAKGEPFYFTYSDIIYTKDVVEKLRDSSGDYCLIVDREYAKVYEGRTDHPLEQAELTSVHPDGRVKNVGKCSCDAKEAVGEFIGLGKLSGKAALEMHKIYKDLEREYQNSNKSFVRAKTWNQAYLCDLLEYMTETKGIEMKPVYIDGQWREIDTVQDKEKADREVYW